VRNPYIVSNNDSSNADNEMFELQNNEKINKNDLFNKLQSVSFQVDSSDDTANIFEQICQQRDNMCFASEQVNANANEDIWVSKEIKFSETFNSFTSSKVKDNVMDISEDDYYLNTNAKKLNTMKEDEETSTSKESLTKTLFQKSSSLTSSSSSSSDDEEEPAKNSKPIFFDTVDKTEKMDDSNPITFDDNSNAPKVSDAALSNVQWTDFSSFAAKLNEQNILPLNDPWNSPKAAPAAAEPAAEEQHIDTNENWANFD